MTVKNIPQPYLVAGFFVGFSGQTNFFEFQEYYFAVVEQPGQLVLAIF